MSVVALASAMLLNGNALAQEIPQTISASVYRPFTDVVAGHWAQKAIAKLSLLQIIKGDAGRFNPASQVKQEDAVIMAIRLMGFESEVNKKSTVVFAESFKVSDYAKPYIVLAFEKGLIKREEEMATDAVVQNWGTTKATREWVAKLVIRTISKQAEADALKQTMSAFKDHSTINPNYVGYINEAVALNIVTGFKDETFKPAGIVTRAEMAAFLSRSEAQLAKVSSKVARGILVDLTATSLKVQDDEGTIKELALTNQTAYYTYREQTAAILPRDLKLFTKVYVVEDAGKAAFVEVIDDKIQLEQLSGYFVKKYPTDKNLALMVDGYYYTYPYSPNLKVIGADGSKLDLSDITVDTEIEIGRDTFNKNPKIQLITVKRIAINKQAQGIVQATDTAGKTIQVKDNTTGIIETFAYNDQLTLRNAEGNQGTITDLHAGDVISYEIKNSAFTSIVVQKEAITSVIGTLTSISADKKSIVISKADNKLAAYYIGSEYNVIIKGIQWAVIEDLEIGDKLELSLNENSEVTKFQLTGREVENFSRAKVYFNDGKVMIFNDLQGTRHVYDITDRSKIISDGVQLPKESSTTLFTKDRMVNVLASGTRLISIELANKFDGVIQAIDITNKKITLNGADNKLMTFSYINPSVEDLFKSTIQLSDVKVGQQVQLILDSSQDKVTSIKMLHTEVMDLVEKDAVNRKVKIRTNVGTIQQFTLDATTPLYRNNKELATWNDLIVGEPMIASFAGTKVQSIQVLDTVRGKVVSVEGAMGRIMVKNNAGKTQVVEAGSKFSIIREGVSSTSLTSVLPNDRIVSYIDSNGTMIINVYTTMQKTVWNWNAVSNVMTLKRSSLDAAYQYPVASNIYVHQGEQTILLTQLKEDDLVTIVLHQGQIIEIEK